MVGQELLIFLVILFAMGFIKPYEGGDGED